MIQMRKYKKIGEFVWHNLCHTVQVKRDYLRYSESGMPYVVDHFVLEVFDANGKKAKSILTETGYRSYMIARKSKYYGGTTHCDKEISNEEFINELKEKLGDEPQQKELF